MKSIKLFALIALSLGLFTIEMKAQRKNKKVIVTTKSYNGKVKQKKVVQTNTRVGRRNRIVRYNTVNTYSRNKIVVVRNRRIRTFNALPLGYTSFAFGGANYYHHAGFCYGYYNNIYRVRPFPRGFRLNVLPIGYHTIIYQGAPRYYYAGTYYSKVDDAYETEAPAVGMIVPDLPEEDLEEVKIGDVSYYEYDDVLYKAVTSDKGQQFEVVGYLND